VRAAVECDRLRARRAALEEQRASLGEELESTREERIATSQALRERVEEEAKALELLRQVMTSSGDAAAELSASPAAAAA